MTGILDSMFHVPSYICQILCFGYLPNNFDTAEYYVPRQKHLSNDNHTAKWAICSTIHTGKKPTTPAKFCHGRNSPKGFIRKKFTEQVARHHEWSVHLIVDQTEIRKFLQGWS